MTFQDRSIQCAECGASFVFTAEEQDFFQAKGFTNEPKRCPSCRQARKERQGNSGYGYSAGSYQPRRQMFPATCSQCGKDTEVPFEPRQGRPVYCSACYDTVKTRR
ncbi:MAG: zinc-ribbon domain containing protein [Chloroflexi bacterium]|nr:zinc-ribbon domain containing protein [Chloroflexota bacterium]